MRHDDPRERRYYGPSGDNPARRRDFDPQGGREEERSGYRAGSPYFDERQGSGRYERGGPGGAYRGSGGGDYGRMSSPEGDDFGGDDDRYSTGRGYGGHGGYGEYGRNEGADYERSGQGRWGGYEGSDFRDAQRGGGRGRQGSISQYGGGYGDFGREGGGYGGGANPSRQGSGHGGMRANQMAQQGGYEWGDDFGASGGTEPDWYRGAGYNDMGTNRRGGAPWGRSDMPRSMPKNYQRTDERIHEDVCEQLSRSGLDVSDISVNVSGGHVTLEGTVDDRYVKHAIENCVDDCSGVQDVDNRIRVQRGTATGGQPGRNPSAAGQETGERRPAEGKGRAGK